MWTQHVSLQYHVPYWHNAHTGVSTWTQPKEPPPRRETVRYEARPPRADVAEPPDAEPLRRFHNWVKAVAIEQAVGARSRAGDLRVLDLACGRGGDLHKWRRFGPLDYVGADASGAVLAEAAARAEQVPEVRATFRELDMRAPDAAARLGGPFDVVSCMFGPHFAYSSDADAATFVEQLRAACPVGGAFACIFPCADAIRSLLGARNAAQSALFSLELAADGVRFRVHGATPDGVEPLLSARRLRADLREAGFDRCVLDASPRALRARFAGASAQRAKMRCPELLNDAQWALADLQHVMVYVRTRV